MSELKKERDEAMRELTPTIVKYLDLLGNESVDRSCKVDCGKGESILLIQVRLCNQFNFDYN
jgi:hypothetical protein